jgi:hypothetical protein
VSVYELPDDEQTEVTLGEWPIPLARSSAAWAGSRARCRRLLPIRQPVVSGVVVLGLYGVAYLAIAHVAGLRDARTLTRRLLRRR